MKQNSQLIRSPALLSVVCRLSIVYTEKSLAVTAPSTKHEQWENVDWGSEYNGNDSRSSDLLSLLSIFRDSNISSTSINDYVVTQLKLLFNTNNLSKIQYLLFI